MRDPTRSRCAPARICHGSSSEERHGYIATPELTLFSYEILGLVGREGAGPHDLLRLAKRAGGSSTGRARASTRKEPGKTRERTVYALTDKGMDALRSYARTPVAFTPLKSDTLLRLLICDLVGEDVTRASMATLRDDIADLQLRLRELVTTFMRRFLDLHLELVEQVERELQPDAAAETPA